MNKDNRYCVIMAGGTSNHFWPISREASPKQFLDIAYTGESFIKTTYDRFSRIVPPENIIVVSLARFADLVRSRFRIFRRTTSFLSLTPEAQARASSTPPTAS